MNIYFENKEFDLTHFISFCRMHLDVNDLDDWRQPIFGFFTEWHNSSDFITVKTSGSTGEPKLISIEKKHAVISAKATLKFLDIQPGGLAWLCLSANYIAGKMMIVRALVGGLDLWISKAESLPTFPGVNKIALAAMVPLQLTNLVEKSYGMSLVDETISHVLIGGGALPKMLEDSLRQLTHACLWHTYGMTETISHIALRKINGIGASPAFSILPGVLIGKNQKGNLVVEYPGIGITNLHTNDLVTLFEDGTFTIDGRADFIINSGSIKINPVLIEKKLDGHLPCPFFITGLPDLHLGEKAVLCIENAGDLLPGICGLWKIIEGLVSKPEIPREIHFLDHFIRSENGKLKRDSTAILLNTRAKITNYNFPQQ